MSSRTSNQKLLEWVDRWTAIFEPDSVYWCDGSVEEYDRLAAELVESGTFERLNDELRPNSYLALSDPADVARVEDRTFIASEHEIDAGPTNNWRDPAELREELRSRYRGDIDQPVLTLVSFGFARGISRTADLVFDMRFADNPHWVDELRPLTGEDREVQDYCASDVAWTPTMDQIESLLIRLIPRYWAAGKSYLTVAFGCTGGRHRSVAAAVEMAKRLRGEGFSPNVRHRDLAKPPSDAVEDIPAEKPSGDSVARAGNDAGE